MIGTLRPIKTALEDLVVTFLFDMWGLVSMTVTAPSYYVGGHSLYMLGSEALAKYDQIHYWRQSQSSTRSENKLQTGHNVSASTHHLRQRNRLLKSRVCVAWYLVTNLHLTRYRQVCR